MRAIWADQLICTFQFQWSPLCSTPIHFTNLPFLMLIAGVVARFLSWLKMLHFLVLLFVLKMNCDQVKHCLFLLLPGLSQSAWTASSKKYSLLFFPSRQWHVITSDCCFCSCWSNMKYFFVSTFSDGSSKLTWQSDCAMWLLCLEVVRGRLSLGLGSVALLFCNHLARRPALCLSAQAIPMMFAAPSHILTLKSN